MAACASCGAPLTDPFRARCGEQCEMSGDTVARSRGCGTDDLPASRYGGHPSRGLRESEGVVDQNSASWNPLISWLQRVDGLRGTA